MVGYSVLDSLDEVRIGEYLMCARGPWITGTNSHGQVVQRQDRTFEGAIIRVCAINPPVMLVTVYPMPCGDPNHDHTPYPALIRWHYMDWSRVNRRYVREYMKAARHGPPRRALPAHDPNAVTPEEFSGMLNEIYENGARPDGAPPEDDDDDFTTTHSD